VRHLFETRTAADGNVSAALAEVAAMRNYPGAEAYLGLTRIRFEVKSIQGRNIKFLLNRSSQDNGFRVFPSSHYYLFVRIRAIRCPQGCAARIGAAADLKRIVQTSGRVGERADAWALPEAFAAGP